MTRRTIVSLCLPLVTLGAAGHAQAPAGQPATGPSGEEAIQWRLFPDRATFPKEERRRFEILDAHWDVPLNEVDPR